MKKMKRNGRFHKPITLVLLVLMITSVFQIMIININGNSANHTNSISSIETDKTGTIQSLDVTETKQWITNPNFDNPPMQLPWNWTRAGDISDVEANTSATHVNYKILGTQQTVSIVADPPSSVEWKNFTNPAFPIYPMGDDGPFGADGQGIDSAGCWASHTWDEDGPSGELGQTPCVHWKRNVTTPVNMSDYEITSASVSAMVNGSVLQDVDCPGDTASGGSDGTVVGAVYDYVRFYVLLSDLPGVKEYEVAYNKTTYLGAGNTVASPSTMGDTYLISVPEEVLIFYLTSVLGTDYCNFTITLGIFIYCEDDDVGYELDTWTMLRIKSFNLTFTYEKKIDRNTYVDWYQVGNELPEGDLQVDYANLKFRYKIDQSWIGTSPNSEIRIWINTATHTETVRLSSATTSFQDAKTGGFDVTSIIQENVNITLYLRVFLADDFRLDRNFTISIDNVLLEITYTLFNVTGDGTPYDPMPLIIGFTVAIVGMAAAFIAYQTHFKYPKLVRTIRSTRKTIDKGKTKKKPITVNKRDEIIQTKVREQQKILEGIQRKGKIMGGK